MRFRVYGEQWPYVGDLAPCPGAVKATNLRKWHGHSQAISWSHWEIDEAAARALVRKHKNLAAMSKQDMYGEWFHEIWIGGI
jgi:hypothetical protein